MEQDGRVGVCGFRGVDVSMDVRVHISDFFLVFILPYVGYKLGESFFSFSCTPLTPFKYSRLESSISSNLKKKIETGKDTPVVNLWWSEWCAGHKRFLLAIVLSVGDLPFTAISHVNHNPNSTGISKSIRLNLPFSCCWCCKFFDLFG